MFQRKMEMLISMIAIFRNWKSYYPFSMFKSRQEVKVSEKKTQTYLITLLLNMLKTRQQILDQRIDFKYVMTLQCHIFNKLFPFVVSRYKVYINIYHIRPIIIFIFLIWLAWNICLKHLLALVINNFK